MVEVRAENLRKAYSAAILQKPSLEIFQRSTIYGSRTSYTFFLSCSHRNTELTGDSFNCSLTKFEAIIVKVLVFYAKFLLGRYDFQSDFYALDFCFA